MTLTSQYNALRESLDKVRPHTFSNRQNRGFICIPYEPWRDFKCVSSLPPLPVEKIDRLIRAAFEWADIQQEGNWVIKHAVLQNLLSSAKAFTPDERKLLGVE